MTLSAVGTARFKMYAVLMLVNTSVLAVSAHINNFQRFFYRADVFPFMLSLVTMVFVTTMIFMDVKFKNTVTARPPFELGWLSLFGTLWLVSNAFSTSRWKYTTPGLCQTIPSDAQYAPYRTWCNEVQALRILVWIEWIMFLSILAYLLRWTIIQRKRGRLDVWSTAFSRFFVYPSAREPQYRGETNSEFLQWEKFPQPQSTSQSPQPGNQEFVRDSYYRDAWQSQIDQNLEPHYNQYSESQYAQSSDQQYIQFPEQQYPQSQETQDTQSLQGRHPIEVPYMPHSHRQYFPPSQTQFTHYPQPYLSGPEHVL